MSKLATLHAGLIARKGEARPAMAHAAFSYVDGPRPAPQPLRHDGEGIERHSLVPAAALPPADAPAAPQPEPVRPPRPARTPARAAPPQKSEDDDHSKPFRLTFRMSADQRRRLRIAAAKEEKSLQELLSDALDGHLDTLCACAMRECSCLAREQGQRDAH